MAKTIEQLLASIKKDSPTPRANFQNIVELLQAVNGKVFSEEEIEGIATDVIKSGLIDNAKPLYFHPISIYSSGSWILSLFIINNNPTAFTKETFLAYIKSLTIARFICSGAYHTETYYLSPAYVFYKENDPHSYLVGIDNLGNNHHDTDNEINFDNIVTNSTFYDGVNKIN